MSKTTAHPMAPFEGSWKPRLLSGGDEQVVVPTGGMGRGRGWPWKQTFVGHLLYECQALAPSS